jgi:hypothetical protein
LISFFSFLRDAEAVDALALELLNYPSELQYAPDGEDVAFPTVSYMQSLSAVVKIVGGDCMMGKASLVSPSSARPFTIDGCNTTKQYDQGSSVSLVLDKRSIRWMVEYLDASIKRS